MVNLIDKSALVAEIERLDALHHLSKNLSGELFIEGLFGFLDTLEAKEVDLEKELQSFNKEIMDDNGFFNPLDIAKHFFELGLKAQKIEH